ncbi:MAG: FimV/HubP family polar landmark protein [Mariprofundaceae bacterium]
MHHKIMLTFCILTLGLMGFVIPSHAVSLGKVDVASHLGESFYAEVPLTLDDEEDISGIAVELASSSDYRILEVYRDRALNQIQANIESDSRGVRIELTSRGAVNAPFINLVVKIRYGLATHFKKYSIFLDLPRTATAPVKPKADEQPQPAVHAVEPIVSHDKSATKNTEGAEAFAPYDNWARTSRYGPMVYGDTLTTVASRLRVDERYSKQQVMIALFEKNRSQFSQDNVNLIKAGTHLDVPTADEVERIRPEQARDILADHNKRWNQLRQQPQFEAVAEAQRSRYSNRVRIGKSATGTDAKPMVKPADDMQDSAVQTGDAMSEVENAVSGKASVENATLKKELAAMEQQNAALQQKIAENDKKISKLSASVTSPDAAASDARIKKLEMQLARLQSELDDARQNTNADGGIGWFIYVLAGLVLILLGGIGYLLSNRKPGHSSEISEEVATPAMPNFDEPVDTADVAMSTQEFESSFGDEEIESPEDIGIPELTDEDTSEFEAFQGDVEDEADPNVDYLSEADVYMRYGMDDEAEQQVLMALKLREDNKEAHVKLVQVRKAREDQEGVDAAITAAKAILVGAGLSYFEEAIDADDDGGGSEDSSLEDTIPPGELNVSEVSSEPQMIEKIAEEAAESSELDDLDLGDIEFNSGEVDKDDGDQESDAGELDFVVEDIAEKVSEEVVEDTSSDNEEDGGLDFDLSGLDLPDFSDDSSDTAESLEVSAADDETMTDAVEAVEEKEDIKEEVQEEADESSMGSLDLSGDDMSFDLTDIEIPDVDSSTNEDESLDTKNMDKTVVMDWDKDTSVMGDLENIGSESGSDFEAVDAAEEVVDAAAEAPVDEPETEEDIVDFDLGDLDVDIGASVEGLDAEVDDFSSTIQANADDIVETEKPEVTIGDVSATDNFGLESLDLSTSEDDASADVDFNVLEDSVANLKTDDDSLDATMQLDSLLEELGSISDEDLPSIDSEDDKDSKA